MTSSYLRFLFMIISFGSFYAWGINLENQLHDLEGLALTSQEQHTQNLLAVLRLTMEQQRSSLEANSSLRERLLNLQNGLKSSLHSLEEILLELDADSDTKRAAIEVFIKLSNVVQSSSLGNTIDTHQFEIISKDFSNLPIFNELIFSTQRKTPRFDALQKTFKGSSHPFLTDEELGTLSYETLTIKQLIIILNKYLNIEKTFHFNKKYYKFLLDVGVPEEIILKMLLNNNQSIKVEALKLIFTEFSQKSHLKHLIYQV